jgi:hypothetical protein
MSKKTDQVSVAGGVQVFEMTMDNPEDQDELNRRLRKPGEHEAGTSPKNGHSARGESTGSTDSEKGEQEKAP